MTVKKAIAIAQEQIKRNHQFIKEIEEVKQIHPDHSEEQLSNRMCLLLTKMADGKIITLKKILKELEPKINIEN